MRYAILLNLFVVVSASSVQAADQSRYRVEIIVLTHLEHDEQPRQRRHWRTPGGTDFLTPPDQTETADAGPAENAEVSAEGAPDTATDPWNAVVHVPELGAQMQDAWRRLRLSEPFRPLQFLAWEQGGNAPFPTLRLHDLELIMTQDPGAGERAVLAEAPPPIHYYRLDGSANLTRSRFLHLTIAVELREPRAGALDPASGPVPTSFLVHRLEQSRVVRTGRMEYFDGPVLGVLAWVTDISESVEEEPAE
jgi:hypothetical protein